MAENIQTFLQSFKKVKQTAPGQYICQCPAHYDKKASLSIKDDTMRSGRILLSCHAGCETADILSSVGKTFADIQPEREPEKPKRLESWQKNLVAEYRYTDAAGNYLYSKLRYEGEEIDGKQIRYGRIMNGKYSAGKDGKTGELYNLPAMLDAIKTGKTIYYVEGEKDVESLRDIGLVAVTAGGTSDWRADFAKYFIGANDVVVIADKDAPGEKLSANVVRDLRTVVYKLRVVTPSSVKHGDVTDYLEDEGGTRDSLLKMIGDTDPIYAKWVGDKGKINPSLLSDAILEHNHVVIARNPGTKSDQLLWYKHGVYKILADSEIDAEIDRYLPAYISNPSLLRNTRQMIIVRARPVLYEEINADERYINVRNGLITVPGFKLIEHTPELISTIQLACEYDPDAKAPNWDKFITDYCRDEDGEVDEEMMRLDRMKTGLILSNIYGYRCKGAFVQYSAEGNTGKSVYLEILAHMLGNDNIASVSFQEMGSDRWATGRCWGKRLVQVGDQGRENISNSKTFKELTGGDRVSAELKGLQHFMYRFTGVILVSCNHLPVFDDDKGNHMSERLNFIHSRNIIAEEDRDIYLRDKLIKETSGILNWAIEGLRDYIDNGNHFCKCESSAALMDEYRQKYDSFYAFLTNECIVTKDNADFVDKVDFEDAYLDFCQQLELYNVSKRNIKDRAAAHGVVLKRLKGYWVYRGVKLRPALDEAVAKDTGFNPLPEAIPF